MDPLTIISLISALIPAINNGVEFIAKARSAVGQGTEWTPEQKAAFDAELAKLTINPEVWQKVQPNP